jgi:hypothetical protein
VSTTTLPVDGGDETDTVDVSGPLGFTYSGDPTDILTPMQNTIAPPEGRICGLGQSGEVQFGANVGSVTAAFMPGRLTVQAIDPNVSVCLVQGLKDTAQPGASVALAVIDPSAGSSLPNPPPLRSLVTVEPAGTWPISVPTVILPIGTLTPTNGSFSQLRIEAGEPAPAGATRQMAALIGPDDVQAFRLELGQGLKNTTGSALAFILSAAHEVHDFDPSPPKVSYWFFASPATDWAICAQTGLQLLRGRVENELNLGFLFDSGVATLLSAWAHVSEVVPPLGDVLAGPTTYGRITNLVPAAAAPDMSAQAIWIRVGALRATDIRFRLPDPTFAPVRAADLVVLQLRYERVALLGTDGALPQLTLAQPDLSGHLTVTFPPQHISEHSSYVASSVVLPGDQATDDALAPPPVPNRVAEPSRLGFSIPPNWQPTSLSLEKLLDWSDFDPDVPDAGAFGPGEQPPAGAALSPPGQNQTLIELPYRIQLSPNHTAGWARERFASADVVALWHARLGVRRPSSGGGSTFLADERDTPTNISVRTLRAVASPDPIASAPSLEPYENVIDAAVRGALVTNMTDFTQPDPSPLSARRLMLSAMGGWLDVTGAWQNDSTDVTAWQHRATVGRDAYVRVAKRGHLFPWGHRASWIKVVERRFGGPSIDPNSNTAYLIERDFIVITQAKCLYPDLVNSANKGRDFPFTEIDITTLSTPELSNPSSFSIPGTQQQTAFWIFIPDPDLGNTPFLFHLVKRDRSHGAEEPGDLCDTEAAAIFVTDGANLAAVASEYNNPSVVRIPGQPQAPLPLNRVGYRNQKIALAVAKAPGDEGTKFEVREISYQTGTFPVSLRSDRLASTLGYYPALATAQVRLPAVQALAQLAGDATVNISYAPAFLGSEFDPQLNPAGVFAQLTSVLPIGFSDDKANGIVSPSMSLSGISRELGPVAGDLSQLLGSAAQFQPGQYFPALDATLLGAVHLTDVIDAGDLLKTAPRLVVDATSTPGQVKTTLDWTPTVKSQLSDGFVTLGFAGAAAPLTMHAERVLSQNTQASATSITTSTLSGIQLSFGKLIAVSIDTLTVSSRNGRKPEVQLTLAVDNPLRLLEKLNFLQPLLDAVRDLLGDGPSVDISGGVIRVGYAIAIPALGIGVFSLENIRVGVAVSIPLRSEPVTLAFNFGEKAHPFDLAISFIGGGGFFAIEVDAHGVRSLELAVEAGAVVALDLGVASGSVHVMIGVYFRFSDQSSAITGYVRASGEVTVLQVLSLYVELYLGLTYQITPRQVIFGEASLQVDVSVAFLHKSVTIKFRREFDVDNGQPPAPTALARAPRALIAKSTPASKPIPVAGLMSLKDWQIYAAAFA